MGLTNLGESVSLLVFDTRLYRWDTELRPFGIDARPDILKLVSEQHHPWGSRTLFPPF
jgi:hypothetical protein